MKKARHIGIVACSAEGAALCYRTICLEGAGIMGEYSHPEVTMHTHPLSEYMRHIKVENWDSVAELMLSSAKKLARIGAKFIICPDNTIHQAFDQVVERSPLPWLHIAEIVAEESTRKNFRLVGVLGTKYLMESSVYPSKLRVRGIKYIIPVINERKRINAIIFNELVNGIFLNESKGYLVKVVDRLRSEGCEAVILGCTEIPLLISEKDSPLPTLDSTRLLARAALREATS